MLVDHCHVRASVCSNSGKPDGYVNFGDISTWASAGEVISFEAHLSGRLLAASRRVSQLFVIRGDMRSMPKSAARRPTWAGPIGHVGGL